MSGIVIFIMVEGPRVALNVPKSNTFADLALQQVCRRASKKKEKLEIGPGPAFDKCS